MYEIVPQSAGLVAWSHEIDIAVFVALYVTPDFPVYVKYKVWTHVYIKTSRFIANSNYIASYIHNVQLYHVQRHKYGYVDINKTLM